jgi:hypothetical protein
MRDSDAPPVASPAPPVVIRFERVGKARKLGTMPPDPAHQLNRSACQADFSYTMVLDVVKIQDRGKGEKLPV